MNKKLIRQIFTDYISIGWGFLSFLSLLYLGYWLIDFETLKATFSIEYAIIHILLHVLISILFSGLIVLRSYKIKTHTINNKKKSGFLSIIGGSIGIIITGCPVCGGRTLISLFGLTNILAYLPRYGLELKLISVFLIFWSIDNILLNINKCQRFSLWAWIKRKNILISILFLIFSILVIRYIMSPENNIKLPGQTFLIPSSNYITFPYKLQNGCSNHLFFIELLPKEQKNINISGIYSYNYEILEEFNDCKYDGLNEELDINTFEKLTNDYRYTGNTKTLNETKYLTEYKQCQDYKYPYCIEGNYWFIKNKIAHKTIVKLKTGFTISAENAISLLDREIEMQKLK